MADLLDTPSRLLRRVQQYEDMELPSLPSFQHDLDDTHGMTDSDESERYAAQTTPHPPRKSVIPPSASTVRPDDSFSSSSSSAAPFPPLGNHDMSQDLSTSASVTYPAGTRSQASTVASDNNTRTTFRPETHRVREPELSADHWEYSAGLQTEHGYYDQSGINQLELLKSAGLGSEKLVPLNDQSADPVARSQTLSVAMSETPLARRIASSNILLNRPRRRTTGAPSSLIADFDSPSLPALPEPSRLDDSRGSANTAQPMQDRVPSLSRSEVSVSDSSGAATTPEGPMRVLAVDTPRSHNRSERMDSEDERSIDDSQRQTSFVHVVMPGQSRLAGLTPRTPALRDISASHQDRFPTPSSSQSKSGYSTPRAPLDDAARRKSHVLAVLNSSTVPPRIRGPRTPHPLRRASLAPDFESISENSPARFTPRSVANTSHAQSEDQSFVSVASSADLTSDRRGTTAPRLSGANASFPNILLDTHAASSPGGSLKAGESRADGIKIHKHLNAMNKQLLETNADLAREAEAWRDECDRLAVLLRDAGVDFSQADITPAARDNSLELPSVDSGLTIGAEAASQVFDGMSPDEHADIMGEMAEKLEILEQGLDDKDRVIADLEAKLAQGTSVDLQRRLAESEAIRESLHDEFAAKTEVHAKRFGEICSSFEEQVKALETELADARAEVRRLQQARIDDLAHSDNARDTELRRRIVDLEVELATAKEDASARTRAAADAEVKIGQLQEDKDDLQRRLERFEQRAADLETKLEEMDTQAVEAADQLQTFEELIEEAEKAKSEAEQRANGLAVELEEVKALAEELGTRLEAQEKAHDDVDVQHDELDRISAELDTLRTELEAATQAVSNKDTEISILQSKLEVAHLAARTATPPSKRDATNSTTDDSLVSHLEDRLDEAYREIGRLKHELHATPNRRNVLEARDERIRALEREKAALTERLARLSARSVGTPAVTPFVHRAIASMRTPLLRTPGSIKEFSFLQTTVGDAAEAALRVQVDHLQAELAHANAQLDQNFSRLEQAGIGAVEVAEKLAVAEDRIRQLEDELRALALKHREGLHTLSLTRRDAERAHGIQAALDAVHAQMRTLRADMDAEKARLANELRRANEQVSELRLRSEKEVQVFRAEMERAEQAMEAKDKEVRRLQAVQRDQDALGSDLHSANVQIRNLERQLDAARDARAGADRAQSTEDAATIAHLTAAARKATAELDAARAQLATTTEALAVADARVTELVREHEAVLRELGAFERDLERQRTESAAFGEQLRALKLEHERRAGGDATQARAVEDARAEADRARRTVARAADNVRAVEGKLERTAAQLDESRRAYADLEAWQRVHECGVSSAALAEQKAKYKAQTRELAAQIRYVKAKCTREATFRNALAAQKRFLVLMVGGMSLNEQATLKAIADMGFPVPAPPRPRRTLKAVATAVLGL
ncbi:hypothetical protein Q5752_004094 [Cryptotrichosporon argae]